MWQEHIQDGSGLVKPELLECMRGGRFWKKKIKQIGTSSLIFFWRNVYALKAKKKKNISTWLLGLLEEVAKSHVWDEVF